MAGAADPLIEVGDALGIDPQRGAGEPDQAGGDEGTEGPAPAPAVDCESGAEQEKGQRRQDMSKPDMNMRTQRRNQQVSGQEPDKSVGGRGLAAAQPDGEGGEPGDREQLERYRKACRASGRYC